MRQLVAPHGHHVALAKEDVARLVHRIGEEEPGELVARGLHLGLHGGVALQLRLAHQREERQHELVGRRHRGMRVDHGLSRIDAAGQVVHDHVVDVVLDVLGGVAIGDDLVVGDEHAGLDAHVLQLDAPLKRAEVMAQMQAARGAVAREHRVLLRVKRKVGANLVTALACGLVAAFVGHGRLRSFIFVPAHCVFVR